MKELLEEVAKQKLEKVKNGELSADEEKAVLKEAMELTDRQIQLTKIESAEVIEEQKAQFEKEKFEASKAEQKRNRIIKAIEIGVPVVLTGLNFAINVYFMKTLVNYEETRNWTNTPGKSLGKLFSLKR